MSLYPEKPLRVGGLRGGEGENQCTLYIIGPLRWLEAGLCPPDVREEPGGALYVPFSIGSSPLAELLSQMD